MCKAFVAAAVIAFISVSAVGQVVVEDSHPFGACKSVWADGALNRLVSAAGSGGFLLDVSDRSDPHPPSGFAAGLTDVGGFVWDIDATDDFVYFAAHRAGLVVFDRPGYTKQGAASLTNGEEARVVSVVTTSDEHVFALVGSANGDGTGSLFLIDLENHQAPVVIHSRSVNAPVYALSADIDLGTDSARVLVGLACDGGPNSDSALLRYDVDLSVASPTIGATPTATWQAATQPAFVRDIVVDVDADFAYVATHQGIIRRFDIDTGLTDMPYYGWPIVATAGRPHALALIKPFDVLAVANGPRFHAETQYWGLCSQRTPCYSAGGDTATFNVKGVQLYRTSTAERIGSVDVDKDVASKLPVPPVGVSLISLDETEETFDLAVASDTWGCQIVHADLNGSEWTVQRIGAWDRLDPASATVPDALSLGAFDGLAVVDGYLYAGVEFGLATLDASSSGELSDILDFDQGPAVLIVGHQGTDAARLFSTATAVPAEGGGVVIWDIEDDETADDFGTAANPGRDPLGAFGTNGTTNCVYPIAPPSSVSSTVSQTWLYAANGIDLSTLHLGQANGGLHVLQIATDAMAKSGVSDLGDYAPDLVANMTAEDSATFMDIVAVQESSTSQIAWAIFGPHLAEDDAGIMTFRVSRRAAPATGVDIEPILNSSLPSPSAKQRLGISSGPNVSVGLLTFDASRDWLYGAFGCEGVAAFDVSDPAYPGPAQRLEFPGEVVIKVALAPDDHVYIGFLKEGYVGVVDASDPTAWNSSTTVLKYPTRFQVVDIVPAPTGIGETPLGRVFVGDARGGVLKMHFQQFDLP